MQCEICGSTVGKPCTVEMDGGIELNVCESCAAFGREKPHEPAKHKEPKPAAAAAERRAEFSPLPECLAENYGAIIQRARERKGLSAKELAEKIFEKESVLHKIEKCLFTPDENLIKKLQNFLGVDLTGGTGGKGGAEPGLSSPRGK